MRNVRVALAVLAILVFGLAGRAEAKHFRFLGAHPIASKYGGGFCYIEAPHIHAYQPDHAPLYQQVGDEYVFTGDPTPFGYDGERHPFYGHHPVVSVNGEPVYCYLDGPHVHPFAAPEGPSYRVKGGVAFYVGPFDPGYARMRPHRVKMVNAEYRPFASFRPTVQVEPPPEWHGEIWIAPPMASVEVQAPGMVIGGPNVVVNAPGPPGVMVSAPGVMVNAPAPRVMVTPPHMVVRAPAPPSVYVGAPGVYVGAPGVYVDGPGHERRGHEERFEERREHHDNGRHNGWDKHGRRD